MPEKLRKIIRIRPPFDMRHKDPEKNYGIGVGKPYNKWLMNFLVIIMTEQRLLKGKYKDSWGETEEEFMYDYNPDAEAIYKEILESFNNDLRPFEKERFFVSAEWNNEKKIMYCDFQKTNSGTLRDNKGYYDRVKCVHCGLVRRRRKIDSSDIKDIKCKKFLEYKQK